MPRLLIRDPVPLREIWRDCNVLQLSQHLGISRNAIYGWRRVPAERVAQVSELTGIPRWRLRPDLWEAPQRVKAKR